jgi:signal transduction histidine kinase
MTASAQVHGVIELVPVMDYVRSGLTWRDGGHPLVMIAIGLAIFLAGDYAILDQNGPLWAHLAIFAVAGVALVLFRRRKPLLALCIGVLAVAVDVPLGLAFPILLLMGDFQYNAVLYTSRRISYVIAVVSVTGAAVQGFLAALQANGWRQGVLTFMALTMLVSIPVWWALSVRWYQDAARAERERTEQLAQLAEQDRAAAVTAERSRLAADLHDVIAGHLSAIALQSEAALSLAGKDPETVSTVLRSVRENSLSALSEMREMIDLLQADGERTAPPRLHDLERLLESARASGLEVSTQVELSGRLPVTVDLAAYRIVQEALTNVAKHAPGARTQVELRRDRHALTVDVRNALAQQAVNGTEGTGLKSMRTRAEAVGGTLTASGTREEWRVRAVLPIEEREGESL